MLVAVSGGADSTALLIVLRALAAERGFDLRAAHLHHGLRGADADTDLAFVAALCARLEVPLIAERIDARRELTRRGLSGQAGLRTLRREFLRDAARDAGAEAIATAHTADDQLETLLMRLMRGTGLVGLGGMAWRRGRWIKPLLEATRAEIETDLGRAGQSWREDASNQDPAYLRNRVRHLVVPALVQARGAGTDSNRERSALARRALRAATEASEANYALRRWMSVVLFRAARIQAGQFELDSTIVRSYPVASRRTLLRMFWNRLGPRHPGLPHLKLQALDHLLQTDRGGCQVELPAGWCAVKEGDTVRFRCGLPEGPEHPVGLDVPGRIRWGGLTLQGGWTSGPLAFDEVLVKNRSAEYFAAEDLQGTLEVRVGQADEYFIPFGGRRPIRLGDFLKKQSIARDRQAGPGVLADSGGILWVIGVRRSARAPITPDTRRALWVHTE